MRSPVGLTLRSNIALAALLIPNLVFGAEPVASPPSEPMASTILQTSDEGEGAPHSDRERPEKLAAGLLVGVLTGLGAGVVDYGLSRALYRVVEPDPEGNFTRAVVVSPYVAFALGAGVGSSLAVNRYGQSLGHQGRLAPTLVGGALGAMALGGGFALTSRFLSGVRVEEGEPYDSFGAAAYGLCIGGVLGGGVGSLLAYEASDPLTKVDGEGISFRFHVAPLATGDKAAPIAMGLGLSGRF